MNRADKRSFWRGPGAAALGRMIGFTLALGGTFFFVWRWSRDLIYRRLVAAVGPYVGEGQISQAERQLRTASELLAAGWGGAAALLLGLMGVVCYFLWRLHGEQARAARRQKHTGALSEVKHLLDSLIRHLAILRDFAGDYGDTRTFEHTWRGFQEKILLAHRQPWFYIVGSYHRLANTFTTLVEGAAGPCIPVALKNIMVRIRIEVNDVLNQPYSNPSAFGQAVRSAEHSIHEILEEARSLSAAVRELAEA